MKDLLGENLPFEPMRAISLWQPWASLVALRIKPHETRSWKAPQTVLGRRIGIHAALSTKGLRENACGEDETLWRYCLALLELSQKEDFPRGVLIATAVVADCRPTEEVEPNIFGDYSAGRFAWVLRDVEQLECPIPMRGHQGIFKIKP